MNSIDYSLDVAWTDPGWLLEKSQSLFEIEMVVFHSHSPRLSDGL